MVADGLVPEHALVPHLDEQASVEVAELAGIGQVVSHLPWRNGD